MNTCLFAVTNNTSENNFLYIQFIDVDRCRKNSQRQEDWDSGSVCLWQPAYSHPHLWSLGEPAGLQPPPQRDSKMFYLCNLIGQKWYQSKTPIFISYILRWNIFSYVYSSFLWTDCNSFPLFYGVAGLFLIDLQCWEPILQGWLSFLHGLGLLSKGHIWITNIFRA